MQLRVDVHPGSNDWKVKISGPYRQTTEGGCPGLRRVYDNEYDSTYAALLEALPSIMHPSNSADTELEISVPLREVEDELMGLGGVRRDNRMTYAKVMREIELLKRYWTVTIKRH